MMEYEEVQIASIPDSQIASILHSSTAGDYSEVPSVSPDSTCIDDSYTEQIGHKKIRIVTADDVRSWQHDDDEAAHRRAKKNHSPKHLASMLRMYATQMIILAFSAYIVVLATVPDSRHPVTTIAWTGAMMSLIFWGFYASLGSESIQVIVATISCSVISGPVLLMLSVVFSTNLLPVCLFFTVFFATSSYMLTMELIRIKSGKAD